MILSVSRRTDIPAFYSEWFFHRIKEGFVYTQNPMNPRQISRMELSPEIVDCIVFWTKNPAPMLGRLEELKDYKYYFQFTLTGYGKDVEPGVPDKKDVMVSVFRQLSQKVGAERVVWRYDPILFTDKYTEEYHLKAFAQIAVALKGYTDTCVISFLDMYSKISKNMRVLGIQDKTDEQLKTFAGKLAEIAHKNRLKLMTCAEEMDLSAYGIGHSSCIDRERVERIIGSNIKVARNKNQRKECGCVESIDIGTYNTCQNGCKYCYANYSQESVMKNSRKYDANSPLLCGQVTEEDRITERKVTSLKEAQQKLIF